MFDHYYSDPHWGHKNIITFSERPYTDVDHMNRDLIARYNAVVRPGHSVLWVGDISMKISTTDLLAFLSQLNGRRGLIRGNHDGSISRCVRLGFDFVADELFVTHADRLCRVKHYPYALHEHEVVALQKKGEHIDDRYPDRRPPRVKGEVLIHGHTHSKKKRKENQIHVGVDAWDYAPAPHAEVEKLVAAI